MAPRWCINIAHKWRLPKVILGLMAVEIPLTIAALALFGIADPDTYRTKLWQNGSDQQFNSNPNEILYAYANYQPIKIPLVWSSFMTKFNVVISVLSMFILLVKSMMFVLSALFPLLSVFVHALLVAIWAVSVRNQATPDLSNTKVPRLSRNLPWYLSKGCSYATSQNHGYCMQARASFAVTCVMLALFFVYLCVSLHSTLSTPAEKQERGADYDEEYELKQARFTMDPDAGLSKEEKWERNRQIFLNLPKTPGTPGQGFPGMPAMTPRTTAFTQLTGSKPSGNVHSGGNGAVGGYHDVGGSSSLRPLALRQQFQQYGEVAVPDPY